MWSEHDRIDIELESLELSDEDLKALAKTKTLKDFSEEGIDNASRYET